MKFLKICALYSSAEEGTLTRLRNHPFMGDGGGGGAGEVAARFICVKLIMVRLNSKVPPAVLLLVRAQDRQRPNGSLGVRVSTFRSKCLCTRID